ncbi:MAG TPA: DUF3592 domain-containing protein [Gemmataceae bacterium]|jgi:hypothetical protein|nr:DUF3592 domain-containing protein [Gemmataceae bacterium]
MKTFPASDWTHLSTDLNSFQEPKTIPPPRRVRRYRGYFALVGQWVIAIPLMMFLFIYVQIAVGTIRFMWFSELVPATVTRAAIEPGGRGGELWILTLAYRYADNDYCQTVRTGIRAGEIFKVGNQVHVQLLPEQADRANLYDPDYPVRLVTVLMCAFGVLPVMVPFKVLWHFILVPWRLRRLLRDGAATSGVIVDKAQVRGRPPTYQITFEYQAPPEPELGQEWSRPVGIRRSMPVPLEDFLAAQIGDRVAVIYRPERPGSGIVPRFTDYQLTHEASS